MNKKRKVLFVFPQKFTFVKLDIEILSSSFQVVENSYNWKRKIGTPFYILRQFFDITLRIFTIDFILISFGGYWAIVPSLLGKIFGKPVYIILHGTDCAAFEEINYGNILKPLLKKILGISYGLATRLLPVSESLIYTENRYFSKEKTIKQGVKHFFPNLKTPHTVVFNGIDIEKWNIDPSFQRNENRLITVMTNQQFVRKGGDLIIEIADRLPEFEFYFVGMNAPDFLAKIPSNVTFINWLSPEELYKEYNKSKYYLQLSVFEGFGVAPCEAMACGCIPIVSSANMLPEIVGNTGYVLPEKNADLLVNLIKKISVENSITPEMARQKIVNDYSKNNRHQELLKVFEKVGTESFVA